MNNRRILTKHSMSSHTRVFVHTFSRMLLHELNLNNLTSDLSINNRMINNPHNDKSFWDVVLQLLSGSAGIVFIGYIVGWIRANAYFGSFGAKWMVSDVTATHLLSLSAFPIGTIVLYLILYLQGISELKPSRQFFNLTFFFGISLTLISWILESMKYYIWSVFTNKISLMTYSFAVASLIHQSLITIKTHKVNWIHLFPFVAYIFFYMLLYHVPSQLGSVEGKRDGDPISTELPHIILKNSSELNWYLLSERGEFYYLVQLPQNKGFTNFKLIHPSEISTIVGKKYFTGQ